MYRIDTTHPPCGGEELEEGEQLHRGDHAEALGVGRYVGHDSHEAVVQGVQLLRDERGERRENRGERRGE